MTRAKRLCLLLSVVFFLNLGTVQSDDNATWPVWEVCGTSTSVVIPAACATFEIPDSCNAELAISLSNNQNAPVFSQTIPLALLESSDMVCVPVELPAVVTFLIGDCSELCVGLGANYSVWPTEACPFFNTDNCTLLATAPTELGCQPAPQLDEPCVSDGNVSFVCQNDCSAPQGDCDQASGYCLCQEGYGGDDCSAECSVSGVLENVGGRFTFLSLADAETMHKVEFRAQPNGQFADLAVEVSSENMAPLKNPDYYWWLEGFGVKAAYVEAYIVASSPFRLRTSQGCPTTDSSTTYVRPNETLVAFFEPSRLFPVPEGQDLWFLSLAPLADAADISVYVYSPWLYTAPIEVFVINGITAWTSANSEVFFRFNLSYATDIQFTASSSNGNIDLLSFSSDGAFPASDPLDSPSTTVSASAASSEPASTWVVRVGLEPSCLECPGSYITLNVYVTPTCPQPCATEHGFCYYNGFCACDSGWDGGDCSTPVCSPPCGDHGACTSPNVCACQDGWSGPYCLDILADTSSDASDWEGTDASTWFDILLAPMLIISFLVLVPLCFWLYSKREECLARPKYEVLPVF